MNSSCYGPCQINISRHDGKKSYMTRPFWWQHDHNITISQYGMSFLAIIKQCYHKLPKHH
uniref:Uncharacterized protein n=1 Tax=Arundo donax TaxID=35708 RepID=A0A0A9I1U0_ARUDO